MPPCLHNPCPESGAWRPVVELRSRSNGEITHLRFPEIAVCDGHKQSNEIAHYLSVEAFDKLIRIMREAGKKIPVRRHTTLTWEPALPGEIPMAAMPELAATETP